MDSLTRRDFLKTTTGVAAASMLALGRRAVAADEEIRVAVLGLHGRGQSHVDAYRGMKGVRIVALCDPDETLHESAAKRVADAQGQAPECYWDLRKVLENDNVDAVSIATPNHWHALATIWACQAGKDVYVEKPCCWCVDEGRKMVQAAEKYGRVVQVGTQRRSEGDCRNAMARLRRGDIGEVVMARATCFKPRPSIGFQPISDPWPGLHYDIWRGPARDLPFTRNYVHYNWHWFWEFGNGDLGNQGVHQMDVAIWGLNKGLPSYVHSRGGRLGYKDQGETANTQVCQYEYDDGAQLVFEVRGLPSAEESGGKIGNQFYGSTGWMAEKDGFKTHIGYNDEVKEFGGDLPAVGGNGNPDPFGNFIEVIRSRKVDDLNAPIEQGHIGATLCHLGNTSLRLRRALQFDPATERFVDDDEANEMLFRRGNGTDFRIPDKV